MSQYQVIATIRGYRAALVFVDADSAVDAIDSAVDAIDRTKMSISARFDKIRAEVVGAGAEDVAPADDDLRCY